MGPPYRIESVLLRYPGASNALFSSFDRSVRMELAPVRVHSKLHLLSRGLGFFSRTMDQDKEHVDASQLVHLSQNFRPSSSLQVKHHAVIRDMREAASNIFLSYPSQDLSTICDDLSLRKLVDPLGAISFSRCRLHSKQPGKF